MQFIPDWTTCFSKEDFELNFEIPFTGPGIYMSASDTMLAVPRPPMDMEDVSVHNVWWVDQPEGTIFDVHVWNCEYRYTMFAALDSIPTRRDTRFKDHYEKEKVDGSA